MGLRDTILAQRDRKVISVSVPEWPEVGTIHVRSLTGSERDAFEFASSRRLKAGVLNDNWRAFCVTAFACDEAGETLFTEADLEQLGKLSAVVLERIRAAGEKLNLLTDASISAAAKNSEPSPADTSTSA